MNVVAPNLGFDYVDVSGFSPVTRPFIREWVEGLDGSPSGDKFVAFDTAAELFFIFRALPDADFPGGKWATIQHLESRIEAVVSAALALAASA